MHDSKQLRSKIRHLRRALTPQQHQQHSRIVAQHAATSRHFQNGKRIAFYLSADGELDTSPLIERAMGYGKRVYLPVLRPALHNTLWFAEFRKGDDLISNRFGIPEPNINRRKPVLPWALDLIYLPLVAFDGEGNRLGMGGGYYDRTLSYLHHHKYWRRPALIGLAHECQQVKNLRKDAWDVPLQGVITEAGLQLFHKRKNGSAQ
ncbi:MAG: 5-formyltetrahydrofolate cyclo-ligase [Candidatus Sedimenticola sp. (ex Thyasira tokunagai)]